MTTHLSNEPAADAPEVPTTTAPLAWDRGSAPYPPPPPGPSYPYPTPGYLPPGYGSASWPHAVPMEAPKAWPVAVFTLLFGIFGAISAARRQSAAHELGVSGRRYWWTFGGTLIVSAAIWVATVVTVIAFVATFADNSGTSTTSSGPVAEDGTWTTSN